eukprot:SAG31_NODE_4714_length_3012_cov_26.602815_2_plen_211_part_00
MPSQKLLLLPRASASKSAETARCLPYQSEHFNVKRRGLTKHHLDKAPSVKQHTCVCVHLCRSARDLANTRGGVATPQYMEDRAVEVCAEHPGEISMSVVDVDEMQEKGMGLVYGVGRAAPSPPRIVYLQYMGNPESASTIALVGKGLTYDTGGLNLKPGGSIETMCVCLLQSLSYSSNAYAQNVWFFLHGTGTPTKCATSHSSHFSLSGC